MPYEIKADRSQVHLLPPSIEDWIPADHPARFIDAFVRSLDLQEMGFTVGRAPRGRPSYSAELLLSLICFCYFSRIQTLRGMERACHDNMAVIWLTGNQRPDHNTIWQFFHNNRESIRQLLKQSARLAASSGLVGMVLHAVDGTKIQARGSTRTASYRHKLESALARVDASIAEMESRIQESHEEGLGSYRLPEEMASKTALKEMIQSKLTELDSADADRLQPSEPDARVVKCDGKKVFGYNAQTVTDAQHGIVVAEDVVAQENDKGMLTPMIDKVRQTVGEVAETTAADKGYSAADDLAEAQGKDYNVLVNLTKNVSPRDDDKPFHTSRFVHDPESDCYICPLGQKLKFQRFKRSRNGKDKLKVYHCSGYKECPRRWECSSNRRGRTIGISPKHRAVAQQIRKQEDPKQRAILKRRAAIVEPTFAHVKHGLHFRRCSQWMLEGARTEWSLICTVVNLRKLFQFWRAGAVVFA